MDISLSASKNALICCSKPITSRLDLKLLENLITNSGDERKLLLNEIPSKEVLKPSNVRFCNLVRYKTSLKSEESSFKVFTFSLVSFNVIVIGNLKAGPSSIAVEELTDTSAGEPSENIFTFIFIG